MTLNIIELKETPVDWIKDSNLKIKDHLLTEARFICSPNQDDRPDIDLTLIVIHGISLPPGDFDSDDIILLFTNQLDCSREIYADLLGVKVSSHILIRRDGEIIQFVPFNRRAWHAGESIFEGMTDCNDFSIGIELEGTDDNPYSEDQYLALNSVIQAIHSEYGPLSLRGHSDVAPGRKTDPGGSFDWSKVRPAEIKRTSP